MTMKTPSDRNATTVSSRRPARALAILAVALTFTVGTIDTADARAGRSGSAGSRGDRTYQAPPSTNTAPSTAAPMERSAAPAPRPGMASPAAPGRGGFFGGGFMGGLMGGLIGAGILGMLLGGGFLSGLGSFAGILGFLLQVLLIVFLVRMAVRFFRNRAGASAGGMNRTGMNAGGMNGGGMNRGGPAYAGAGAMHRNAMGGAQQGTGYGSGRGPAGAARPVDALGIRPEDYQAFESILGTVQTAYAAEDLNTLRSAATPEMVSYFSEEIADNQRRGVANRISDVRLLQGDLAESWREGNAEYATVAMRFSLIDVTVERATGRPVEGNADTPTEATEVWTFVRPRGGRWQLSAIQQTR